MSLVRRCEDVSSEGDVRMSLVRRDVRMSLVRVM